MSAPTWREVTGEAIAAGVDATDARRIGEEASGAEGTEWVVALDQPCTAITYARHQKMVERRLAGEPLQYVLGRWGFRQLDLLVDRRVLIPRPETEWVVELALRALPDRSDPPAVVVDLGTGSGAIALSIACERWPGVEVHATDASPEACAVTRANTAGLGRRGTAVRVHEGDWWGALPADLAGRVDLVVSNPPYVAASDPLPPEVERWEPAGALVSGPTGLEALEVVIAGAPAWLAPGGTLVCEIGETQAAAVIGLAGDAGFAAATVHPDLTGRDRVLVARS